MAPDEVWSRFLSPCEKELQVSGDARIIYMQSKSTHSRRSVEILRRESCTPGDGAVLLHNLEAWGKGVWGRAGLFKRVRFEVRA